MSKKALRKELAGFTTDQLIDVILACYDSSAQARDYFEFFLDPDVEALIEKRLEEIDKELRRIKWSHCKARVSIINGAIKSFAAYGVPQGELARLLCSVLVYMIRVERVSYLSDTHYRAFARYLTQYLEIMNSTGAMSVALKNLAAMREYGSDTIISIIDSVSGDFAARYGSALRNKTL